MTVGLLAGSMVALALAATPLPPAALRRPAPEVEGLGPLAAPDFGPCDRPGESVAERMERRTRPLLGTPYVRSPLGEGRAPDDDPRIRFDAFDCTTWVETALALATCDERSLLERLDAIRYVEGEVSFETRRHLVTAQWVPGLESLGLLRRRTADVFPAATERIELRLGPARWEGRRIAKTLSLPTDAVPLGTHRVDYVPVNWVRTRSASFAPGTIVNVVRVDWFPSPDVVTHQGLVVEVDGEVVVRHASLRSRRVVDEPLPQFVQRFAEPRKWPIAGFQLLEPSPSKTPESGTKSAAESSAPETTAEPGSPIPR